MFRYRKALVCLGLVIASGLTNNQTAHALPLLAQNAGIYVNDLITAYPDHEDPSLVYFMPNSSSMAKDAAGLPQFGFTYWGLSNGGPIADAGAYLSFTMRLNPDESMKRALDDLRAHGKRIAVVPVQAATVGITTTQPGAQPLGALFKEFNFAKMAGRAEDEVGVNAVMTGIGAKVFKAAIDTPQLFKMDYCYKVQGLGPNFDASIHVDFARVYDHFEANASGGSWFTSWSIHTEVEKLRQQGVVRIQINGGDAKMDEYVQKVAEKIVERIFKPELSASPGSGGGNGGSSFSFSRFSLSVTHKEELKQEDWSYTKRELVEREFCANMSIKDIKPVKDQLVRDADKN
ncbi:MAG: hypothetical protein ACXVBE_06755 [Bdellovibrionota bacterium]